MKEIINTDIWDLLEKGKNYNRMQTLYEQAEDNYDQYHGRQWKNLKKPKSAGEPIVLNIIKPIVKNKINTVNESSYEIVFNPNTYETEEELESLRAVAKGLTQFIMRMWEKSQSGKKVRSIVKNSCITSEGIIYFFNEDDNIKSEEVYKNNIYYGNENDSDIQNQPYILATFRRTVKEVREKARKYKEVNKNELTDDEIKNIVSDMDYWEETSKDKRVVEVSPMCTVVRKFERKEDGKIWISESTRTCEILKEQSTECELYPFAHYVWEDEVGYARGVSEISFIIDNQRAINKIATRRDIATTIGAYPKLVADTSVVKNPQALNQVGSTVELNGMRADDVNKVVSYLRPVSMSADAYNLQQDLIQGTKELLGAGDVALGNVNPEQASGKAILAVMNASKQPLNEQVENFKYFLEDCAKIILDIIKAYYIDGITLYTTTDEINDLGQTEQIETPFKITQEELEKLDLNLKIDITPQSAYDKYAQEMSLENLLIKGMITLEEYAEALPEDSTMPKPTLESIIRKRQEKRNKIAQMQQEMNAYDSAIKQEIAMMGGDTSEMSSMQASGNASGENITEQNNPQM
ncbi:MAG: hypothetical protein K1W33_07095 [Clostridia bacterium]